MTCSHKEYHEDCECCMNQFRLANKLEIKLNGEKETIKKYKESGYFG